MRSVAHFKNKVYTALTKLNMECILCELQYVGQTVNGPRRVPGVEVSGHRGWMKMMKKSKKTEDNEEEPERFRRKDEGALALAEQ